ncbi:SDR family NAD(P)-dependent oxidoreductase [Chitinophaga sp. Mgbs1]|uniref:SDR family NAD(P)-dependent oxidoreductase n=1 Tax=Chitinophaga solisilvae TaxID=1233460 RepID=A0A433WCH7_9BACT|nr:SDR family NAD(P)-dependent oxidoreductase [Chitinophaga solisilvae]
MSTNKVWFITGASRGFGRDLVTQLLEQGYRVAATSRNLDELRKIATDSNFLPLAADPATEATVAKAIADTVQHFGSIDVVVNNAGYGLIGGLEEVSDAEARANFEINVFGTLNVIRKALPYLRKQRSGHILNISSIGGTTGDFPGFGIYCATKFAVNGLSESLAAELKPFGINVSIISPGYFRTSFLSSGSLHTPENEIPEYLSIREVQQAHQHSYNGNQPGDPVKAVQAMIKITEVENPPLHLFLGEDAFGLAADKFNQLTTEIKEWREITVSTGF